LRIKNPKIHAEDHDTSVLEGTFLDHKPMVKRFYREPFMRIIVCGSITLVLF